jgi:hypothetical protein
MLIGMLDMTQEVVLGRSIGEVHIINIKPKNGNL